MLVKLSACQGGVNMNLPEFFLPIDRVAFGLRDIAFVVVDTVLALLFG